MSDILRKDIRRESWGAQAGEPPTSGQPAYCIDVVTSVPQYLTYFYTRNDGQVTTIIVSNGTKDTITTTCYPPSPGDSGTPAVPPTNVTRVSIGWDGSAISVDSLAADGQYEFSVDRNAVGVVTGLNDNNIGSGYIEIPFGIYFRTGQAVVLERGQTKSATVAYLTSDRFTITRVGGAVKYWQNGTLLHTSEFTSSGVVRADASLYFGNDTIIDPELAATVGTEFLATTASLAGTLTGISGFLLSGTDAGYTANDVLGGMVANFQSYPSGDIAGTLTGMTSFIADVNTVQLLGTLPGMQSTFVGGDDASLGALVGVLDGLRGQFVTADVPGSLTGVLGGMSAYFEAGLLMPDFAALDLVLQPLSSFSIALAGMTGVLTGVLGGMRGFAANAPNSTNTWTGTLPGMTGFFANVGTAQLAGVLPSLEGTFLDAAVAVGTSGSIDGDLPGMTGVFSDSVSVSSIGPGLPPPPTGVDPTTGDWPGRSGSELRSLIVEIYDRTVYDPPNIGGIGPGLPPTTANPINDVGDWEGRSGDQLRAMVGLFFDSTAGAPIAVAGDPGVLPMLQVQASIGTDNKLRGNVVLPYPLTTEVRFGLRATINLPALDVAAAGTIDNVLRATLTLPRLEVEAHGLIGTVVQAALTLPHPLAVYAVPGWRGARLILPSLEVVGRITTDLRLSAALRLPFLRVSASIGAPTGVLRAFLVLPALQAVHGAHASILLPRLVVSAQISQPAAEQTRIAYAMNLKTGGVTEFTNFAFRAIGRAYNRYWAVGMDGNLYRMGGDLDDTAPIAWEWESGIEDFGSPGQKGVSAVYVDAIFENGATLLLQTDDARRVYSHRAAGNYNNHRQHRIPLGKGVRSLNLGFGMANPKGGYLELDRLTPEYVIIPRNL